MESLESKLLDDRRAGREIDLERALLIVSGLETEEEIAKYTGKIGELEDRFREHAPDCEDEIQIARELHEFLWHEKPNRYNSNFLLTQVLDAQLHDDPNTTVGNCVGLTSLYTVLGLRQDLNLTILELPDHVLSRLQVGQKTYDIENTNKSGFGATQDGREKPATILIPIVYNSRGSAKMKSGDPRGAITDYNKAIQHNPEDAIAYYNRGNAKDERGDHKGAINDYNKAIQHNPEYSIAYYNRGCAKDELGDPRGAINDYIKAIELNPKFITAKENLEIAKRLLSRRSAD